MSAQLFVDDELALEFLDEAPPSIRVVGYPRQLDVATELDSFVTRMAPESDMKLRQVLREIVDVTELQIEKKLSDIRSDIRKLALLSARSKCAKAASAELGPEVSETRSLP